MFVNACNYCHVIHCMYMRVIKTTCRCTVARAHLEKMSLDLMSLDILSLEVLSSDVLSGYHQTVPTMSSDKISLIYKISKSVTTLSAATER